MGQVQRDQLAARECYLAMLAMDEHVQKMNIDEGKITAEPTEVLEDVPLDESSPEKFTRIRADMEDEAKHALVQFLKKSLDVFAWGHKDMPGIDPSVITYSLNVCPYSKPMCQKKRVFAPERDNAIKEEVQKLITVKFIREVYYPDCYPLPRIDQLVDSTTGHKLLSFMDAFLGYNLIKMDGADQEKTAFITSQGLFCYKVKSLDEGNHIDDLQETFDTLQPYNMKLNPSKCAFEVSLGKFLRYLPRSAIKAQALADFITEFTPSQDKLDKDEGGERWVINVDGSSTLYAGGIGVILKSPEGDRLEYAVRLQEENMEADTLAKAASAGGVTNEYNEVHYMSSIDLPDIQQIGGRENWMSPIATYLKEGRLLEDKDEIRKLRVRAAKYILINEMLYKRGFSQPYLRCLAPDKSNYVLREVHEGACGNYSGARLFVHKVVRAGYYWPTMQADTKAYVKVCDKC
ncbi:uncharacterized protein LOC142609179 [Castanea sativa]|uniref:uncharacterized protein LOC142609179 n=1 Tax=Castanea sativa TaxID=21020 RepID=UPI003F64A6D1